MILNSAFFFYVVKELMAQWKRLTDNYKKARRRRISKSGDPGCKKLSTCEFYEQLCFIEKGIPPTESYTNFPSEANGDVPEKHTEKSLDETPRRNEYHSRSRKKSNEMAVDALIAKALCDDNEKQKPTVVEKVEEDSDTLFCKSLISTFQELTPKKRKKARVKVLQVLCDLDE